MDAISSLFHHVALVSENEGWYEPLRFSPERIADYEQNRPYAPYSRCAAGVTLEFETEADEIAFDYEMLPFSAGKSLDGYSTSDVFDVYENGVYALTVSPAIHKGRFRYRKQNPGRVRFCIYTPVGAMVRFSRFSLGDFSPVPAPPRKLLIVGDSISQGLFGTHPSLSAAARLSRELDADLLNASIGGDCFRPGLIPEDLPWRPDAIVVELGTNDFCFIKDRKTIEENVRGFFCDLDERFSHVPCVVVSPFWMTDWDELTDGRPAYTEWLKGLLQEICDRVVYLHFLDGFRVIPHEYHNFCDSTHPSDDGFAAMASAIGSELKKYI